MKHIAVALSLLAIFGCSATRAGLPDTNADQLLRSLVSQQRAFLELSFDESELVSFEAIFEKKWQSSLATELRHSIPGLDLDHQTSLILAEVANWR